MERRAFRRVFLFYPPIYSPGVLCPLCRRSRPGSDSRCLAPSCHRLTQRRGIINVPYRVSSGQSPRRTTNGKSQWQLSLGGKNLTGCSIPQVVDATQTVHEFGATERSRRWPLPARRLMQRHPIAGLGYRLGRTDAEKDEADVSLRLLNVAQVLSGSLCRSYLPLVTHLSRAGHAPPLAPTQSASSQLTFVPPSNAPIFQGEESISH